MQSNLITLNLDKFKSNQSNILFITGLSGSGKSTIADKLSNKYNSIIIELDEFQYYETFKNEKNLTEGEKIIKKFIDKNCKNINLNAIDIIEFYNNFIKFFNYLIELANKNKNKKYIIEGVQIYCFIEYDEIKQYPLIIVDTKIVRSIFQRYKRNEINRFDLFKRIFDIKNNLSTYKWYKSENNQLNKFKNNIKINNDVSYKINDFLYRF